MSYDTQSIDLSVHSDKHGQSFLRAWKRMFGAMRPLIASDSQTLSKDTYKTK